MTRLDLIGEIAACVCLFLFLGIVIVGGSVIAPYQPGPDSETVLAEVQP